MVKPNNSGWNDPKLWVTIIAMLLTQATASGIMSANLNNLRVSVEELKKAQGEYLTRAEAMLLDKAYEIKISNLESRVSRLERRR